MKVPITGLFSQQSIHLDHFEQKMEMKWCAVSGLNSAVNPEFVCQVI